MSENESPDSDLESWLSPSEALSRVSEYLDDSQIAKRAVINRLRGGQIRAWASKSVETGRERTGTAIPKDEWGNYSSASDDFWHTGDVRFYFRVRRIDGTTARTIRYFGIKLEKAGIDALIADLPKGPKAAPTARKQHPSAQVSVSNDDEGFSGWLTPEEVLKRAQRHHGEQASRIIMERLRANFLIAVASRWSDATTGSEPEVSDEPTPIPANFWPELQREDVFGAQGTQLFSGMIQSILTGPCAAPAFGFWRRPLNECFQARSTRNAGVRLAPLSNQSWGRWKCQL